MNVLVACEFSGTVREAFRKKGHNAWSCDLLPPSDASPFHHIYDCRSVISKGWDLIIAHPPCTHIAVSGARHFEEKKKDGRFQQGVEFFKEIVKLCQLHSAHYAVENPVCVMSSLYMKPSQIVQPWWFGHGETKSTCLWLGNLPLLKPTKLVRGRVDRIHRLPPSADRWKIRSKTYQGFADAMAEQWGDL